MTREEMEALFALPKRQAMLPQDDRKDAIIYNLQYTFKNAAIKAILEMPPGSEKEQERFMQHVWKAYAIAISVHDETFMLPSDTINNISEFTLTKFYRDLQNASNDNPPNDSKI